MRRPCELVLGLLMIVWLAIDVQAAPLMAVLEEGWFGAVRNITIGVLLAQPALLGVWAVLGPQRAWVQWPRALAVLILVWWADTLGARGGWNPEPVRSLDDNATYPFSIDVEDACLVCGVYLALFLLVELPLVVARFAWHWRLSRPLVPTRFGRRQFSLRHVFGWTALVAVLLAASRYLLQHQSWGELPKPPWMPLLRHLGFYVGFLTQALFPILLPAVPMIGLVLGRRRRVVFLISTIVCAAVGAAASVAFIADQNASVRLQDGCFEEFGFCGAVLLALSVVRACGFRLAPFEGPAK